MRNLKRGLRRDQHFAPGTILRHPGRHQRIRSATAWRRDTFGFYNNSPFFALLESFNSLKPTIVARYPNQDVVASGWLRGEEAMAGRAAVVSVDMNPGRVVLFGLRPQHRAPDPRHLPDAVQLAVSLRDRQRRRDRDQPVIRIVVTGGTFDKEYNELTGTLFFKDTHLPEMLRLGRCRLERVDPAR